MNSAGCSIKADFLEHQGRKLFYLLLQPTAAESKGSILFLPPFAEEMHKSRRLVATQARELACAGYSVMLLDLTGCGDSGGDFSDASWEVWLQDAACAAECLLGLANGPFMLWGLRMGALLAAELAQGRSDIGRLLLWQPVLNGEQQIDQFLRLRTVASIVSSPAGFDRTSLWNELRSGRSLDIAGYTLSASLALEMARVRLNDFAPGCPVHWMEIGISPNRSLAVPSESVIAHWRARQQQVDTAFVYGEPFWRTIDAENNQALLRDTLEYFTRS
jgi:exosortase A-associated hydrolase 2